MRALSITYKGAFLIGGALFAVVSYIIGTVVYQAELQIYDTGAMMSRPIWQMLEEIGQRHLLTFVPWVVGTTILSIVLGNLYSRQHELRRVAEALSVTDSLTLLYNHRYLVQQLALEIERSRRSLISKFAVLMIDIDDFKQFNDRRGHLAGDSELRQVASAAQQACRETDIVARYGGEEIVVVAPGSDRVGGAELAERIRLRVKHGTNVTVSIGVSAFPEDGQGVDELIGAADEAMYVAKRGSKDKVCLAGSPSA